MDPLKPVPVIGATPVIGGNFASCRHQPMGIGTFELKGSKRIYKQRWKETSATRCKRCKTTVFAPKVLGICTDCYADAIAVIRHEERLAA